MEAIAYFNTDYFLLELQRAGVIKNNHKDDSQLLSLEKVPNITIGLVIATKSLKKFENHIVLNWIRKGRKVTALIEDQFALYDKLAVYLQSIVCTEEVIQEWKQILDETKYVFPEKQHTGWSLIFGNTPNLLEKVDPDNIHNANIVQVSKTAIEREDGKIKQNETQKNNTDDEYCKLKENNSKAFFSHRYFSSLLQEVGAIVSNDIDKDIPVNLSKVPNITIGLVLAAKAINYFRDEEILTWIRKGRKLTPLIEKQFLLYEKLSDYLMNYIDLKDIDKWKSLFDFKYVFPSSDKEGWSLIFGEIPELCHKIDEAQKSFKQLEVQKTFKQVGTSRVENDGANESCELSETSKIECDEALKSFKQLESSNMEIDDAKKCNPFENPKTEETLKIFNAETDETKCLIYNPDVSIDEIAVDETEKEDKFETVNEIKSAAHTGSKNDENINDKVNVEISVYEIKEVEEKNEASILKQDVFKESNNDQNRYIDKINLSGNEISLADNDYSSDQIKYIEQNDTEFPNLSGDKINFSELCKEKMSQSENDDSSDLDDELEDLFNAVGEELTVAENEEKSKWESINIKNEENHKYLSRSLIQSEIDINNENNSNTTDTISTCMKHSGNNVDHKSEKAHGGFTRDYFFTIINKAGMLTEIKEHRKLTSNAKITVGLLCSIKALDLFTNEEIFLWIKKCYKLSREISFPDHIKLASYRELANYLMNEVDIKDVANWKTFLHGKYHDYTEKTECDKVRYLQNNEWKVVFGNEKLIPEICHSVKIKFNHKYYFAQLLGFDAIKWEMKNGILQSYLVKMVKPQKLTVGLVLAAKAVGIFSDSNIVSWIGMCEIFFIDSEKIQKQLAIYKEFSNYLEKEADERDYEHVRCKLFKTVYKPWIKDTEFPSGWIECFHQTINLHKRFRNFKCYYDGLLGSKKLDSQEVVDPVHYEPNVVCKTWKELFEENSDHVSGNHSKDKLFHSHYFRNLLNAENVTAELKKVEKITVGLVMAAIHEKYMWHDISNWVEECNGTKPSRRQFFLYKLLCTQLLGLECNIEASYWKQLINSVEYQVPMENFDIWSNIFGTQIPNLLGVTFVGKFEFERKYQYLTNKVSEIQLEKLKCIQFTHDLQSLACGSIDEKQNLIFDKEYFASLLTSCGALSSSSRILKSMEVLTIGQVMAAIIDSTLNDEDIYEWIKQCEKDSCTKKTLETLDLKSQFVAYRLLASHLMNYQSENQHDLYLISWRNILSTQYVFSHLSNCPLENLVSPQINSIYLSTTWSVSQKYELKTVVNIIRKSFQTQSFKDLYDIMLSNKKSMPIIKIMNRKKIFGIGKSFFQKLLIKDKVLNMANQLKYSTYKKVKNITLGHVVGILALGIFKDIVIKNWITKSKRKTYYDVKPGRKFQPGSIPFGPLKRITHYLLCEVPSELAMEWIEMLNKTNLKNPKEKITGNNQCSIQSLFGKMNKKYLCNYITKYKREVDYFPNECKNFIRGRCYKEDCCKPHMCTRMKFCMSFPKSSDIKATEDESESLISSKDETASNYQKELMGGVASKKKAVKAALKKHKMDKKTERPLKVKYEKSNRIPVLVKPGLCFKFNGHGNCLNNPCRWPHQCNKCLGAHPGYKCTLFGKIAQRKERIAEGGKEKDGSKRKSSINPSPVQHKSKRRRSTSPSVHNSSNYLPVRDEPPSWQHQLPSLPSQQGSAPYSYPHMSQSAYQSQMLNTSISHRSMSLTLSMNETMYGIREKQLSMNELMSEVVEKVAKATFNKDTSCIVQHIKREVEYSGIPATLDNVGKLVLEVSEIHKMKAMRGDISDNYDHGSSSNPMKEPSVSIGYEQPNWNQSNEMSSQQSTGYMYQSNAGVPPMPMNSFGYNMPSNKIRKQMHSEQYRNRLYSNDHYQNPQSLQQMHTEQYKRRKFTKDHSQNPNKKKNQGHQRIIHKAKFEKKRKTS